MRRERGPYRYRRLQLLEGFSKDAYKAARKPRGAVLCPRCGALYRRGRWSWDAAPAVVTRQRCPACRRIEERYASSYVSLAGAFYRAHREEILGRLRNCEAREKAEHPMERIVGIEQRAGGATVSTTSPHLARVLAHALRESFKGELELSYHKRESLQRARWSRTD